MTLIDIAHFQVTFPILMLGITIGLTYGLLAVGLVLVFRSSRVINFAHAEIGLVAASLLVLAVTRWQVPYWVAFIGALAIGAVFGGASEVIVVRRLRRAPILMSVVATLGLAGVFDSLASTINGQLSFGTQFPAPSIFPTFSIGPLPISSADSAMMITGPVVVILLAVFFRRSRIGLAIRASAADRDLTGLAGVSASMMATYSWAIAGALAAYTVVLLLPSENGFGSSSNALLGPDLLLRVLSAAVIARMRSLPTAFAAGIGVGVVEQVLLWNYPNSNVVEAILFLVIVVALLLQRGRTGRAEDKGAWAAVQAWPAVPQALRHLRQVRRLPAYAAVTFAVVAVGVGLLATPTADFNLSEMVAYALAGLSIGVITGLGGQLSLGQFALAGVGATAAYLVTLHTASYVIGYVGAALVSAAVAVILGTPALRIKGLMLAVVTLGFAVAANAWLFPQPWMLGAQSGASSALTGGGGSYGVNVGTPSLFGLNIDTPKKYYFFALVILFIGLWLARNIWRSGFSRRLRAVRDNEIGARAFTIPVSRVLLQAFALSGLLAGLAGAVFADALTRLPSAAFDPTESLNVAVLTVLGGIGILAGPLLGVLYTIGVPSFLPLNNAETLASSVGWLLVVLYLPGGFAQAVRPLRDRLVAYLATHSNQTAAPEQAVAATEALEGQQAVTAAGEDRDEIVVQMPRAKQITDAVAPRPDPPVGRPLLEVRDLTKHFGGVAAVNGVSLELRAGETLGIIGANGAGKTTLFELIGGFTTPDSGEVFLEGRNITKLSPESRARLGLIRSFQDAALFPTLTVQEVVMLALERVAPTSVLRSLAGLRREERRKEKRASEVIELMGLRAFEDKQIRQLSTGTRRITELACLIVLEPTVLLLDEPSSGVAQRETEALAGLLRSIRDQMKVPMVVIEHDMPLLMGFVDRVIALETGTVIANGTPEQVQADDKVIAAYLGTDFRALTRSS